MGRRQTDRQTLTEVGFLNHFCNIYNPSLHEQGFFNHFMIVKKAAHIYYYVLHLKQLYIVYLLIYVQQKIVVLGSFMHY